MSYSFINGSASANGTSLYPSAGVDMTGADLIVGTNTAYASTGFSDDQGNTYTGLTALDAGGPIIQLWYKQAPTVSATHKFQATGTAAGSAVGGFSGSLSSPFDNENGNYDGAPGSSLQLSAITPSATELVVTSCSSANGQPAGNTWAIDSGYSIAASKADDGVYPCALGYLLAASGSQNPTWSWTGAGNPRMAVIASFKVAAVVIEVLHPDSDITDGGWTTDTGGAVLYAAIDEVAADDVDYIQSSFSPVNDTCEVSLQNPSGALVAPFVVRYRYCKTTEDRQIDLTVNLIQGTTVITTWTHTDISTTIAEAAQTLSGGEGSSISDFNDLRLRFKANAP